jgi:LacI family transcriptional regulator
VIPDDIAIIGFDDLPIAQVTEPPLTTIRQPLFEMGSESVRMLFRRLDGDRRALERKALETEFVARASA